MILSGSLAGQPETRERLLDAAESLFGERGFKGTSLRAITDRAGANVASVSYHFGSKLELLRAVLLRAYGYVAGRQIEMLDELERRESGYLLRDLVETMVLPFFELSDRDRERVQSVSQLMARLLSVRDSEVRSALEEKSREIEDRYARAMAEALPGLTDEELRWRYRSCIAVVIHDQTAPVPEAASFTEDYQRERLISFIEAAMSASAPSSDVWQGRSEAEGPGDER